MQSCKSAWVCKLQATMCKWSAGVVRILISHWGRSQRSQHSAWQTCFLDAGVGFVVVKSWWPRTSWGPNGSYFSSCVLLQTGLIDLSSEFFTLIKDAYTKQCNECNVMIRRTVVNQIVEAACMQRTPSWHTCGASLMIHEHEPNTPWKQDRSLFACIEFWFVGCCSWVGSWLKASYRVLTQHHPC